MAVDQLNFGDCCNDMISRDVVSSSFKNQNPDKQDLLAHVAHVERVKMVKSTLRHGMGVCCVRQLNILLALNEITQ
jgi:hypothetical protein